MNRLIRYRVHCIRLLLARPIYISAANSSITIWWKVEGTWDVDGRWRGVR
jgi:hypothetical protein